MLKTRPFCVQNVYFDLHVVWMLPQKAFEVVLANTSHPQIAWASARIVCLLSFYNPYLLTSSFQCTQYNGVQPRVIISPNLTDKNILETFDLLSFAHHMLIVCLVPRK